MTYPYDEEQDQDTPEDVPAPPPAPDVPDTPEPAQSLPSDADPMEAFAQYGSPAQYQNQPPPFDLPPPPMKAAPSEGPAVVGLLSDLLLNRGRNVPSMIAGLGNPGDTDYENWKRNADYAKTRYALTAPRRGGFMSPIAQALQAQRLKQAQDRLALQKSSEGRKSKAAEDAEARYKEQNDPNSETSKRYRDMAVSAGIDATMVDGRSAAEVQKLAPSINFGAQRTGALGKADVQHAAEKTQAEGYARVAPQVAAENALIAPRAATAGATAEASSKARIPTEKEMADYQATIRSAGPKLDEHTQTLLDEWEMEHPEMHVSAPETFVRNRLNAGRGEVKARGDEQQAARLMRAMKDMRDVVEESNRVGGDIKRQYELMRKYNIAQSKATGALSELSHNNTESGRTLDAGKIPSFLNPDRGQMLRDAEDVYSNAAGGIMATYGVSMGPRPAQTEQGGDLGVTRTAGPKVNKVVGTKAPKPESATGTRLKLPDGSSAADTPANRAKLKRANIQFEVQ